jgi:hypothetical protein
MKNAERLGRRELYQAAFRRYCELSGMDGCADVLRDVWKAISAFELLMTERNGKTYPRQSHSTETRPRWPNKVSRRPCSKADPKRRVCYAY